MLGTNVAASVWQDDPTGRLPRFRYASNMPVPLSPPYQLFRETLISLGLTRQFAITRQCAIYTSKPILNKGYHEKLMTAASLR